MTGKIGVECVEFKPMERGTLRGFATVRIPSMRLTIKDVAVHDKDGRQWAQLPAKPQLDRDRQLVMKDGKVQYVPILLFDSREVSDAFSAAVLRAVGERGASV
jgi:hypothetical protein